MKTLWSSYKGRQSSECGVVMHSVAPVCLSVCVFCSCSNFWKSWPINFRSWLAVTFSVYLVHVRTSRSSGQGQGHSSKKARLCVCVSCVVCMLLKGNLVHAYSACFCFHLYSKQHCIILLIKRSVCVARQSPIINVLNNSRKIPAQRACCTVATSDRQNTI